MAIRTQRGGRNAERSSLYRLVHNDRLRQSLVQHLPAWLLLFAIIAMMLPSLIGGAAHLTGSAINSVLMWGESVTAGIRQPKRTTSNVIAPLFTPQIDYWSGDIEKWAEQHGLDPNLLATVMQIESCGHPTVSSVSGAQGLFQVMPFHFATGENQIDPNTNAARGADFLNSCLGWSSGDTGLAMACYNGGPSVLQKPQSAWSDQTRRYYYWGTGIYADAQAERDSSVTLNEWLTAGGERLCSTASAQLGM